MEETMKRFREYVLEHEKKGNHLHQTQDEFINDMLYGIGISVDPDKFKNKTGFAAFGRVLVGHANKLVYGIK